MTTISIDLEDASRRAAATADDPWSILAETFMKGVDLQIARNTLSVDTALKLISDLVKEARDRDRKGALSHGMRVFINGIEELARAF